MKKRLIIGWLLIITSLLLLTGCSANDESDELVSKAEQEVSYLNTEIIKYINSLNNIYTANYKVTSVEIKEEKALQTSEESSSKNSNSQSSSSSQSSTNSSSNSDTNKQQKASTMVPDNILNSSDDVDWKTLKNNVENLYSSWSIIILDLYKLGVNNENIIAFSSEFDNLIINAKEEDKTKCIASLAKMYGYLPGYLEKYSSNNNMINIIKTKSSVLNAYSALEEDNWQEVQNQLLQADTNFMLVLNNVTDKQNKIYNVNKAYILLKELQNSIKSQDKDVFYIKYKSLIEELNILREK